MPQAGFGPSRFHSLWHSYAVFHPRFLLFSICLILPAGGKLARRIGATRHEVNRLTNLKHATKIDRIDAALRALGKRPYLNAT